jgi:hypothetical protein
MIMVYIYEPFSDRLAGYARVSSSYTAELRQDIGYANHAEVIL